MEELVTDGSWLLQLFNANANVGLWQLVGWAATVLGSWSHLNQAPGGFLLKLTTPFFQDARWTVKCENNLGLDLSMARG